MRGLEFSVAQWVKPGMLPLWQGSFGPPIKSLATNFWCSKKKKEEEEEENIKLKENPGVTFPSVWTAMRFLQLKQLRKWIKKFFFFF